MNLATKELLIEVMKLKGEGRSAKQGFKIPVAYENNIKIQHFPNIHIKKKEKEKDYFYYLCNIRWHRVLFVLLAFLIFL